MRSGLLLPGGIGDKHGYAGSAAQHAAHDHLRARRSGAGNCEAMHFCPAGSTTSKGGRSLPSGKFVESGLFITSLQQLLCCVGPAVRRQSERRFVPFGQFLRGRVGVMHRDSSPSSERRRRRRRWRHRRRCLRSRRRGGACWGCVLRLAPQAQRGGSGRRERRGRHGKGGHHDAEPDIVARRQICGRLAYSVAGGVWRPPPRQNLSRQNTAQDHTSQPGQITGQDRADATLCAVFVCLKALGRMLVTWSAAVITG